MRVPEPHQFVDGVLVMELLQGATLGERARVLPLEQVVGLFGQHGRVRLHDAYAVRGRPLILEGDAPRGRAVFENPRRNPLTGDIEDVRPPPGDDRS